MIKSKYNIFHDQKRKVVFEDDVELLTFILLHCGAVSIIFYLSGRINNKPT